MKHLRWYCVASFVLAALGAMGPVASGETCRLELKRLGASPVADESVYRSTSSQRFFLQLGARGYSSISPYGDFRNVVRKEPAKYVSKDPFRGVAKLGSSQFGFVLDARDEKSKGYDRLHFDCNGNGDLTDDKPIDSTTKQPPAVAVARNSEFASHDFPRVDLKILVDGQSVDYSFRFHAYSHASGDFRYVSASLTAAAYRAGEITLDGKRRQVVLLDYNGNGRFDDQTSIPENIAFASGEIYAQMGDVLLIDRGDRQYVSRLANVDGKFYDLKISPAGDQLTLTPSTLRVGHITNSNGAFRAMIYGDRGFLSIGGEGGKPVAVPEGQWRLLSCEIDIRGWKPPASAEKPPPPKGLLDALAKALGQSEEQRNEPRYGPPGICSVSAFGTTRCKAVSVREGETVALAFGPPYKPRVEASMPRFVGGAEVSLSMTLVGSGGEVVGSLVVDGYRPPRPEITITNAKGEVVQKGNFEYG